MTNKITAQVAQGNIEARDTHAIGTLGGWLTMLAIVGFAPALLVGPGRWIQATWGAGVPVAGAAALCFHAAGKKRQAIAIAAQQETTNL